MGMFTSVVPMGIPVHRIPRNIITTRFADVVNGRRSIMLHLAMGSLCTAVCVPLAESLADQLNDCLPWCAAESTTVLELLSHTRPKAASGFTLREVVADIDACAATSTLFWTISPVGFSAIPPHTHRGLNSTAYRC